MPPHDRLWIGEGLTNEDELLRVGIPYAEGTSRNASEKAHPPTATTIKIYQRAVVHDVAYVGPTQVPVMDDGHVDISAQGGENEIGIGEDDSSYHAGEMAEAAVVLWLESGDVDPGGEIEEAYGTVEEAAGEMEIGKC